MCALEVTYFLYFPSGSTDPSVLAMTSSEEGKRQTYIHELISTEESYMADMSVVMDVSTGQTLYNTVFILL